MPLDISSRITLAEGFSYLHRKVSLLNVFHAINWVDEPNAEYDFVALFECFGLREGAGRELLLEILHEVDGLPCVADRRETLVRGEVPEAQFAVVSFEGVHFPAVGRYNVAVSVDGESAGQWPLVVRRSNQ